MYLLRDLDDRFLQHTEQISGLACLLPANLTEASIDHEKVADCLQFYEKILPDQSGVAAELKLWCAKWNDCGNSPATAIEALEKCEAAFFPNINVLLRVFATLPVTTCTAERSFSVLRILKTYLRSTMNEEKLTGMTLLYIHSNILINIEKVIDRFAVKKSRLTFNI